MRSVPRPASRRTTLSDDQTARPVYRQGSRGRTIASAFRLAAWPLRTTSVTAPCPDCSAPLGGREGCEAAFNELGARASENAAFAYRRRAIVDAYCLQHPAYILSLKSFAAHLCGLCAAVEYAHDARAARAVWSNLRLPPGSVKPSLPADRGGLTLIGVCRAPTPEGFRAAADEWISAVWSAWSVHHHLARTWLEHSMNSQR
jgi:hypothetical protein